MAVVHHDKGLMLFCQIADFVKLGIVPVHAEHTVGGDHPCFRTGGFFKTFFQGLHVSMGITEPGRLAQTDAVDNRGMIQGIRDYRVFFAEQCFKKTGIGIEA